MMDALSHPSSLPALLSRTHCFTSEQIEGLIHRQQQEGGNLLRKCLELASLTEETFLPVLADAMSLPRVDLASARPGVELLSLLPAKVVYQFKVIPLEAVEQ
jgi:hypothetical protein